MSREFYVPCTPYAYPIKSKLPNVGHHLRSLLKWRNSKKTKSKEEVTVFPLADASLIIPNITEEILERVLPESLDEEVDENGVNLQTDVPLTKSCSLAFQECPSISFSPVDVPSSPSTSSSNPRLTTSEAIIEKIMSEASAIQVSSSNPSASALPSNALVNGISGVNLANMVNDAIRDAILPRDPVDFLLSINSQIGSQAGRERDTPSAPSYLMNESRTESFSGSSTFGNLTNTTGSENSSMSEMMETMESQMDQDPNRQYYAIIRSIVRKQFESLDDDPPIY